MVVAEYCCTHSRAWLIKCEHTPSGEMSMIMLSPIAHVSRGQARGGGRTGYGSVSENLAWVQYYGFSNTK